MRRHASAFRAVLALGLALALPVAYGQDHGHGKGEDHGHRSPHGGEVVSIGKYHVELLFSAEEGGVTLFVLGGDETSPEPIEGKALTAQCKASGAADYVALTLEPAPQADDPKGRASRFKGRAEQLEGAASLDIVVHVLVGGKRFRASATLSGGTHAAYSCPMGCEKDKTYTQPGACPVCGMHLKRVAAGHDDGSAPLHSDAYRMDLVTDPATPMAGKPTTLLFTPRRTSDGSVVKKLEIVHEQPLHLIMVSRGLGWYGHEHPAQRADGSLALTFTFPVGGEYILFADITVEGDGNQVFPIAMRVEGKPVPVAALEVDVRETRRIGDYEVTLAPSALVAGKHVTLAYRVRKGGKDVTDLQPYLGALGHCVFISEDGTRYLHSHPAEEHREGGAHGHGGHSESGGPVVEFATLFPSPGLYKGWAQFRHQKRVLTAEFTVRISASSEGGGGKHGH